MAETKIADGLPALTGTARARRALLTSVIGNDSRSILEIGALDNPTFLPSEGEVHYLDYFSTAQLKKNLCGTSNRALERLVDVTYVLNGTTMREVVDRTFDLVIANHVIEHVPDLIGWMKEVAELTEPGSYLFMSIPDRRFTFDYFRPVTDAVELVRAHDEQRTKPSEYQIARHLYYFTRLNSVDAWAGKVPARLVPRMNFYKAIQEGRKAASVYTDVHCWVFTEDSFLQIFEDLSSAGFIPWRLHHLEPVRARDNEFRVILRRT